MKLLMESHFGLHLGKLQPYLLIRRHNKTLQLITELITAIKSFIAQVQGVWNQFFSFFTEA
jgi:hypothetical protein